MPIESNHFRVTVAYRAGERQPKRLVVTANGPLGWGRSCPFCSFNISHRKQRGGGNQWGNVARANAAVIDHMRRTHPEKLEKSK